MPEVTIDPGILKVKDRHLRSLLSKPNVVGVGAGVKIKRGKVTDTPSIIVYVKRKVPENHLKPEEAVPRRIDDIETDVVEVGLVTALALSRTDRWRPAPGGVSVGHYKITAGTLGGVCFDAKTGEKLVISNNHVFADENRARIGDPILQPGPYDGGRLGRDNIAVLKDFVKIRFIDECEKCKWIAKLAQIIVDAMNLGCKIKAECKPENYVDAAVAKPIKDDMVSEDILEIGRVMGVSSAKPRQTVIKSGRSTGVTKGVVIDTHASLRVLYDHGEAFFVDQIIVYHSGVRFSAPGDSGSLVLDESNNVVGLLFAGSDKVTVVNKVENVVKLLGVKFA